MTAKARFLASRDSYMLPRSELLRELARWKALRTLHALMVVRSQHPSSFAVDKLMSGSRANKKPGAKGQQPGRRRHPSPHDDSRTEPT